MTVTLSPTDLRNLRKAAATLTEALAEIDRAERAGIDMSDARAAYEALREHTTNLLAEYGKVSPSDL